jgi:hypothetical protein
VEIRYRCRSLDSLRSLGMTAAPGYFARLIS